MPVPCLPLRVRHVVLCGMTGKMLFFIKSDVAKIFFVIFAIWNYNIYMAKTHNNITESEVLARLAAQGMDNKKGIDIVILDLRGIATAPTNFFVICSGNVPSHVSAISDGVFETIKKATGYNPHKVEGYDNAEWILMDYFDIVVHIFLKDKREHYRLEQLWADGIATRYESAQ